MNAALDKDKSRPRCTKGGKHHEVSVCSTNMEKVKCYKCGKAVAIPFFGSVEPCELLETRSSWHDASGSKWVLFEQQALNATV